VDTVTSGWDIAGSIGEIVGGIGAGGALIFVALAFWHQVADKRREQASRITLSFDPPLSDLSEPVKREMTVKRPLVSVLPGGTGPAGDAARARTAGVPAVDRRGV
jgi:hypothetical protein